jgi:alanyl-tRNA synthetase
LIQQQDFIGKVIKEEEEAFLRTLDKGLKKIDTVIAQSKAADNQISGTDAFELLDTFGFPIDLTILIAQENNLTVDEAGFEKEMKVQKDRSRAATALDTEDWQIVNEGNSNGFVGYDNLEVQTKILKYRKVKGKGKELFQIVLDTTPFYAESGGQVGDSGSLTVNGSRIQIIDTKKENDLIIHFAENVPADMNGHVEAKVDADRRKHITVHHSVTHLMHSALRSVLGAHVAQKGSMVNEEHLRFDFSHFAKMTDEEISKVEKIVNEKIRENVPVVIKSMSKDEAVAMGAMALFGEKYGDVVRVVIMDPNYSIELCGGTHVGHTGEIGYFKIKSESAVAAGVRRIEAVSGKAAENMLNEMVAQLTLVKEQLKHPKDLQKAIENLMAENNSLSKRIESLEARQLVGIRNELLQKDVIIENVSFIGEVVEVPSADALKKLCLDVKHHLHDHLIVLCTNIGGKAYVAVGISETVIAAKNIDANKIIKETVGPLINGGGGGQKTLATSGGQEVGNFEKVIDAVRGLIKV